MCCLLEVRHLFAVQRPVDDRLVAVAQPFLEHLIAADPAFPDRLRNPAPKARRVQSDIEDMSPEDVGVRSQRGLRRGRSALIGTAAKRHGHAGIGAIAPARQIPVALHTRPGRGNGDRCQLRPGGAAADTGHGRVRVEQRGELGAQSRRSMQEIRASRQRYARPALAKAARVLGKIKRTVEAGERMMEQQRGRFRRWLQAQGVQVGDRCFGQVGAWRTGQVVYYRNKVSVGAKRVLISQAGGPISRKALRIGCSLRANQ